MQLVPYSKWDGYASWWFLVAEVKVIKLETSLTSELVFFFSILPLHAWRFYAPCPPLKRESLVVPKRRSQLPPVLLLLFGSAIHTSCVFIRMVCLFAVPWVFLLFLFLSCSFSWTSCCLDGSMCKYTSLFTPLVASLMVYFSYNGVLQLIYQTSQQSLMVGNYLNIIGYQRNQIDYTTLSKNYLLADLSCWIRPKVHHAHILTPGVIKARYMENSIRKGQAFLL